MSGLFADPFCLLLHLFSLLVILDKHHNGAYRQAVQAAAVRAQMHTGKVRCGVHLRTCHTMSPRLTPWHDSMKPSEYHTVLLLVLPAAVHTQISFEMLNPQADALGFRNRFIEMHLDAGDQVGHNSRVHYRPAPPVTRATP